MNSCQATGLPRLHRPRRLRPRRRPLRPRRAFARRFRFSSADTKGTITPSLPSITRVGPPARTAQSAAVQPGVNSPDARDANTRRPSPSTISRSRSAETRICPSRSRSPAARRNPAPASVARQHNSRAPTLTRVSAIPSQRSTPPCVPDRADQYTTRPIRTTPLAVRCSTS